MVAGQNRTDLAVKTEGLGGQILVSVSLGLAFVGGSVEVWFVVADRSERFYASVSTCKENFALSLVTTLSSTQNSLIH